MNAIAKYVIGLTLASIFTFAVFNSLSKFLSPPAVGAQPIPSAEIIFEPENTAQHADNNFDPISLLDPKTSPAGLEPKTKPAGLEKENHEIIEISTPPRVLVRVPGIMPKNAQNSGSCIFDLDINGQGSVQSVNNLECTDPIFIEPTQTALKKWVLTPKVENGQLVETSQRNVKMNYVLHDEDGNIIRK